MGEQRTTRVMCAADPRGDGEALERLLGSADPSRVEAVALVGDLSGVTTRDEAERFPYRPARIVDSVADIVEELGA